MNDGRSIPDLRIRTGLSIDPSDRGQARRPTERRIIFMLDIAANKDA